MKRLALIFLLTLPVCTWLFTNRTFKAAQSPRSFGESTDEIANYDVRTDASKAGSAARAQLRLKLSPQQAARNAATVFLMRDAQANLQCRRNHWHQTQSGDVETQKRRRGRAHIHL